MVRAETRRPRRCPAAAPPLPRAFRSQRCVPVRDRCVDGNWSVPLTQARRYDSRTTIFSPEGTYCRLPAPRPALSLHRSLAKTGHTSPPASVSPDAHRARRLNASSAAIPRPLRFSCRSTVPGRVRHGGDQPVWVGSRCADQGRCRARGRKADVLQAARHRQNSGEDVQDRRSYRLRGGWDHLRRQYSCQLLPLGISAVPVPVR